ncbi:MAG: GNAT family N-acetyltransferase [Succinivibrio sp.]
MARSEFCFASAADADEIIALEGDLFSKEEGASPESIRARIRAYPKHFWLLKQDGAIAAYVDGALTLERDLQDEMYSDTSCHREDGRWQMLFGVGCARPFQGRGLATRLFGHVVEDCRGRGYDGVVLTCHEALIPFYRNAGFADEGLSASVHGGAAWHQMRITFK